MHFTTPIAFAILAATSLAAPAPIESRNTAATLSLTAQLTLADTAGDRFTILSKNEDFLFDFNKPRGLAGKGGDLFAANRKTFPALVGTGSGMAVGFLNACGFNTPHLHPRATELQVVTAGRLVVEMVPENGVLENGRRRLITNTVAANQMTPFYQGSVHAQFNPDCEPATFVASFNSEDFGAGQVVEEVLALSQEVVKAAFGQSVDGADIDKFKGAVPASIALGVEACLAKCGIAKR